MKGEWPETRQAGRGQNDQSLYKQQPYASDALESEEGIG